MDRDLIQPPQEKTSADNEMCESELEPPRQFSAGRTLAWIFIPGVLYLLLGPLLNYNGRIKATLSPPDASGRAAMQIHVFNFSTFYRVECGSLNVHLVRSDGITTDLQVPWKPSGFILGFTRNALGMAKGAIAIPRTRNHTLYANLKLPEGFESAQAKLSADVDLECLVTPIWLILIAEKVPSLRIKPGRVHKQREHVSIN